MRLIYSQQPLTTWIPTHSHATSTSLRSVSLRFIPYARTPLFGDVLPFAALTPVGRALLRRVRPCGATVYFLTPPYVPFIDDCCCANSATLLYSSVKPMIVNRICAILIIYLLLLLQGIHIRSQLV